MPDSVLAIFSDVHSNLEALEAVIADMKNLPIRRHFCLGDVVGYGADPVSALELVRSLQCPVIMGNHDAAVGCDSDLNEMSNSAKTGARYSRLKLSREQRDWLAGLPLTLTDEQCEFVHGTLDSPSEWFYAVGPEDIALHFAAQICPICFCGHTHDPMFWHSNGAGKLSVRYGQGRISIPSEGKTLINVGSVGQPRDGNRDACYVVYNPQARWVEFHRVPYNISKAMRKIIKAGLPHFSADRLSLGR